MSFGKLGALGRGFGHLGAGGQAGAPHNTLRARAGSFILTGTDMTPKYAYVVPAALGTFALTGIDATLTYTPSGPPATSYVTGDRTASITVTNNVSMAAPATALVNGVIGAGSPDATFWSGAVLTSDQIVFDFGTPKYVTEAKWYQSDSSTGGVWQWIGSSNGTTGTNIGSSFTLGGFTNPTPQVMTELNTNVTAYRYYILQGVSGTKNNTPWLEEIEFKQN